MSHSTNKPILKLRNAPQPPLSHAGAIPDSDRAQRPLLPEPSATGQELTPGDRVEGLGTFGKPTGEFGTLSELAKRTRLSNGMMMVVRDSTSRRSQGFRRPITVVYIRDFRPWERRDVQVRPHPQAFPRACQLGVGPHR